MLVKSLILIQSDKHTHSGKQNIQVTLCRMLLYQKTSFSENTLQLLAQW